MSPGHTLSRDSNCPGRKHEPFAAGAIDIIYYALFQHLQPLALNEAHSVLSQLVGLALLQQPTLISLFVQ